MYACISHHAVMLLAEIEHDMEHVQISSSSSYSSQRSSYLITVRYSWRIAHGPFCGYDEVWGKLDLASRCWNPRSQTAIFPALNVTFMCVRPLRIEIDA